MKLIDYIKSTRRGREANRIEREAMGDPFLSDAIEGFDAVYGNHPDKLKSLEEAIARRAARRRRKMRGGSVIDVPENVPHLLPVGDKDPGHISPPGKGAFAYRQPEKDRDNAGAAETVRMKTKPAGVADKKDLSVAAASQASPENAEEHAGDRTLPAEEIAAPGEEEGAGGVQKSVIFDAGHVPEPRKSRWLAGVIAAAVALALAGGAWYYFEYVMPEEAVMIAKEERGIPVHEPLISDAPEAALSETTDLQGETLEPEAVAQQLAVAERPAVMRNAEPRQAAVTAEQKKEAERKSGIDGGETPTASGKEFDAAAVVNQRLPVAVAAIMGSEKGGDADNVSDMPVRTAKDDAHAGNVDKGAGSALDDAGQDAGSAPKAATADEADASAARPAATYATRTGVETVRNEVFVNYFNENRTLQDVSGTVVMEFRVNSRGVPSGIKVLSSPSAKAGQEAVRLLVSGPQWTPSNGRRIRTTVEYK